MRRNSAEVLLTDVLHLAALLGRSAPSHYRDAEAGRVPAPLRIGGSKRWRVDEIRAWVAAGCPDHASWVAMPAARPWHPLTATDPANNRAERGTGGGAD